VPIEDLRPWCGTAELGKVGVMTSTTSRAGPAVASASPIHIERKRPWLGLGLIVLGLGAALVAVLGPLVVGVIDYHASEGAVNQIVGGDVAGLFLVAPVSIAAGIMVWRGRLAGFFLALGPAFYALYMCSQLALGGDISRYPGNSERFFPLYVGLFLLAAAIAIPSWQAAEMGDLPATNLRVNRTIAVFFLVVAVFLTFGLHLPGLIDAWSADPISAEYLADPVVFWLVKFMDLGLVVPGLVATGVGILRGAPWAGKVRYVAVGWAALLGSSVAGMAIVMQAAGDPGATIANTIAFSSFAAIAIAMALIVYRPLFRRNRAAGRRAASR